MRTIDCTLLGLGLSFAGGGLLLCWKWIWRPLRLVRSCRRQGLSEHPRSLPIWRWLSSSKFIRFNLASWTDLIGLRHQKETFFFVSGNVLRIVLLNPASVKQILMENATCYCKPAFIRSLKVLGDGLFSANGDSWDHQRQYIGPLFHMKAIKNHFETILTSALKTTEAWGLSLEDDHGEVDIDQKFLDLTLELIGQIAFAANLKIPPGKSTEISRRFKRYLQNKWHLSFGPAAFIPGYKILNMGLLKEIHEDERRLNVVVEEIIEDRARELACTSSTNDHGVIFIDRLLGAQSLMPSGNIGNEHVRDNCFTFLLAGHETTSSLLTWSVYLLSINQLWQERARAEVHEFFSKQMELKKITHLKIITMIIFESLRLFPPQPIIGRYCIKNNLVGNHEIARGMEIIIPVAALHRDPDIWGDDANDFRPSRFANGINGACKHPSAYLPFGVGPRTCVGQTLALLEAKIILAVMLDKYSWELSEAYEHDPHVSLTLQPKFGLRIHITKL